MKEGLVFVNTVALWCVLIIFWAAIISIYDRVEYQGYNPTGKTIHYLGFICISVYCITKYFLH